MWNIRVVKGKEGQVMGCLVNSWDNFRDDSKP